MARYDENILQICADSLYSEAQSIIWKTTVKYGCVSFLFGIIAFPIALKLAGVSPLPAFPILLTFMVIIGVAMGISAGQVLAFDKKLEAQRILVLAQIERNTRANVRELEQTAAAD